MHRNVLHRITFVLRTFNGIPATASTASTATTAAGRCYFFSGRAAALISMTKIIIRLICQFWSKQKRENTPSQMVSLRIGLCLG